MLTSLLLTSLLFGPVADTAAAPPFKVLFLGDRGHHQPALRYRQLASAWAKEPIKLEYSEDAKVLNSDTLNKFDALMIYANTEKITPEQEKALLDYVRSGKGFVPVHCASYCFLNSPEYIKLVGAQFQRHGTGTVRTIVKEPDHAILKGWKPFASWDETYVHTKHNAEGRTVLETRKEGSQEEPWTWVRDEGKGRVFYTAWGHDDRTWGEAGFQKLLQRGLYWAAGKNPESAGTYRGVPEMTKVAKDLAPFEYQPARVPFYPAERGGSNAPLGTMQKPLDVAQSMKHIVHPTDFELKLFASEPMIEGKPIALNWDERGRLWIAETIDYPNEKRPKGQGRDRIRILEDTDGDGVADKATIFADKLSIPTSLIFVKGGVLVHQAPDTLLLSDTNGDDVADERKVLFTGWSTGDTHAGPSNLHYGLDNWIYFMLGYAGYRGQVGGEDLEFRTGFVRMKPDGSKMEFLRNTNNNSWGIGLSEEGILFGSTANGNPSEYMPIANRYYEAVRGWSSSALSGIAGNPKFAAVTEKIRQVDFHGGFTAAAGHALYTARNYPKEYWNRTAFVAEPTGHLLATFEIEGEGANFRSKPSWNLLAANDEWVAPIVGEIGPDGNVWVIDWYNYIVQHNPTPNGFTTGRGNAYETPLRDKNHGRIYRLVAKANPGELTFNLKGATPEKLVATLRHPNMFWRNHAQRLLVERGQQDVVPALLEILANPKVDEIGLDVGAMHAIWTLHGLGAIKEAKVAEALTAALKHTAPGVRRNAALALPLTAEAATSIIDAGLTEDANAQVRLAAFLALADRPASPKAPAALAKALGDPIVSADKWLPDAITAAAAKQEGSFLSVWLNQPGEPDAASRKVALIVAEHVARGNPTGRAKEIVTALASASPERAAVVLKGLVKGWPAGKVPLDGATDKALEDLLTKLSASGRSDLIRLGDKWQVESLLKQTEKLVKDLLATLLDEAKSESDRANAAAQAIDFRKGDPELAKKILGLITPQTSPDFASALIEAVGRSEAPVAGDIIQASSGWSPSVRTQSLRLLAQRSPWTPALLDACEKGTVRLTDLPLDQQRAMADHPDRKIASRARTLLEKGGSLPNADRQKVIEQLASVTKKTGDVPHGKAIYVQHCAKCHVHSAVTGPGIPPGGIGPELSGMAAHPKEELLIHIMDPSRGVEGNFRAWTIVTKKGQLITGLMSSETKTTLELIDSEGKKHQLNRSDIDEISVSPKSLMPEGFEKQVSEKDLADLLEFMTQRGKFLPLPLDKVANIATDRGMFFGPDSVGDRMIFDDWKPKTFAGVPFMLIDPKEGAKPNAVMLYGPNGSTAPKMPRLVAMNVSGSVRAIHLLSGVGGWNFPALPKGSTSMIVRLTYEDGSKEDHALRNGEHFSDYIRRVDVPGSQFAFDLQGKQVRYLAITPKKSLPLKSIEFVKGRDGSAPVVMAVTIEGP